MERPPRRIASVSALKRFPPHASHGKHDVGQELHLGRDDALALADLAPPARDVEREVARVVSGDARAARRGVDPADLVVALHVGDGIRARGPADRGLIHHHHVAQAARAQKLAMRARGARGLLVAAALGAQQRRVERLFDEAALSRAGHARDAREDAQRDPDVDVLEVVRRRADQLDHTVLHGDAAAARDRDDFAPGQIHAGPRGGHARDLLRRSLRHDLPPLLARRGAEVDDGVRRADHRLVVLDDDERVAQVLQLPHDPDEAVAVARVQADRRLVEHVERPHQAGAQARRQADPLRLAARERPRHAVERQVVQADLVEIAQAPRISLRIGSEISSSCPVSSRLSKNSRHHAIVIRQTSATSSPPSFTARTSGRSRPPAHAVHVR
jgi:hypothetical protein